MGESKPKKYFAVWFLIAAIFTASVPWFADSIGLIPVGDFRPASIVVASALALLVCLVGPAVMAGKTRKQTRKIRSVAVVAFLVLLVVCLFWPSSAEIGESAGPDGQTFRVLSALLYWMLYSAFALVVISAGIVLERDV
jgi:hypothetical protein